MQELPRLPVPFLRNKVKDTWCDGTCKERPHERSVEGARPKKSLWSHHAPKDRAVEVDAGNGAGEAVDRFWGADPRDIGEHPVQDANLRQARDDGCGQLKVEQDPWRDLHIMPQLQVGTEFQPLRRGNVAIRHKNHIRDGPARKHNTANQLADEVYAILLVGDGHDDANGDEEHSADPQREEQTIPRQIHGEELDDKDADGEHAHPRKQVPRHRHVRVPAHETVVHVLAGHEVVQPWIRAAGPHACEAGARLERFNEVPVACRAIAVHGLVDEFLRAYLPPGALPLLHDVVAVPARRVRQQRRQRSELQRVREHVGDWQEDAGVVLVGVVVEDEFVGEDALDIVGLALVVEDACREDGHVGGIHDVGVVHDGCDDPHHYDQTADDV